MDDATPQSRPPVATRVLRNAEGWTKTGPVERAAIIDNHGAGSLVAPQLSMLPAPNPLTGVNPRWRDRRNSGWALGRSQVG